MTKYECVICKKEILKHKSQVRNPNGITCSIECRKIHLSKTMTGENNPNYRTGFYSEPSKCECGNEKDARSKSCHACAKSGFPINNGIPEWQKDKAALEEKIRAANTYSDLAKALGTSRGTIRKYVEKNGINIDHFKPTSYRPMKEKMLSKTNVKRYGLVKSFIIENGLVENKCAADGCSIKDEWLGKPVVLELHHIDGNPYNNQIENLMLLCPMCHSQTENYKGRNNE